MIKDVEVTKVDIKASRNWQMIQAVPLHDEIIAIAPELDLQAVTAAENIVDDIPSFWLEKK